MNHNILRPWRQRRLIGKNMKLYFSVGRTAAQKQRKIMRKFPEIRDDNFDFHNLQLYLNLSLLKLICDNQQ